MPTTICLPFPADEFERRSVVGGDGGDWVARYCALLKATSPEKLIVLNLGAEHDPYGTCNLAVLRLSITGSMQPMLLALWNGEVGDGPGGTADMIERVHKVGGHVVILDPSTLA